ncbi:MAG TPA: hypothetical protein VNI57_12440 [Candidatus Saccharimonadales bacterium]|nr:hypothetical protein [Candidatus Saccharimonadales bacterium]
MPLNRGDRKSSLSLDWFNVSYRSIVLFVLGIATVGAVVGGGIYYKYIYQGDPRARAAEAIASAEKYLEQADGEKIPDEGQDLKATAQRLLADSRRHFDAANFEDATRAAEQSQMSSRRLMSLIKGEAARSAQFYKIEGDVRVKRAREMVWIPAEKGMALSAGDQIKTSSRSAAQIIYFNGTITTVTPGSLLEIKELYDNPSTRIQQVREQLREGRIASLTQEPSTQGSYHEIATRNSVAVTQDRASLEVAYDEEQGKTRLAVHSGKTEVKSPEGGKAVEVEAGEGVTVDRGSHVSEKKLLPPTPLLEEPIDHKIIQLGDANDGPVDLSWQKVPGAKRYRLQVANQALFSDTLVDKTVPTNSATLPGTTEGSYYWRISALFDDGTEGPSSEVRKFRVVAGTLSPIGDKEPPILIIDDFLPFATQVIVRGRTEPGALLSVDGTRIDVLDDGSFTSVIPLRRTGVVKLVFTAQDVAGNTTRVERTVTVDTY